ncbi:MAG: 50S ribosomal protein L17 [Candidatus Peregrinibacteria bacterium]
MRHRVKGHRLGRTDAPRKALIRNLVTSLILHEKIVTTEAKAKAIAPLFDRLVTTVKNKDSMNAIRDVKRMVFGEVAQRKMMDDIKPRFENRSSGYTRIRKIGFRDGDGAPEVRLEIFTEINA